MTSNEKAAAVLFALMTNCPDCCDLLSLWDTRSIDRNVDSAKYCSRCCLHFYANKAHRRAIYGMPDNWSTAGIRFLDDRS